MIDAFYLPPTTLASTGVTTVPAAGNPSWRRGTAATITFAVPEPVGLVVLLGTIVLQRNRNRRPSN